MRIIFLMMWNLLRKLFSHGGGKTVLNSGGNSVRKQSAKYRSRFIYRCNNRCQEHSPKNEGNLPLFGFTRTTKVRAGLFATTKRKVK